MVPITIVILVAVFVAQSRGTAASAGFGPVVILWFVALAVLGVPHIVRNPVVFAASILCTGAVLQGSRFRGVLHARRVLPLRDRARGALCDMGHFGRAPIRIAWFALVLPGLCLNYLGQGALLLSDPTARVNPFYRMAPDWGLYPLVFLATCATVIASQAVISGSFSLTQQAMQLGYSPRFGLQHTSARERGQVYVPEVNWLLMLATIGLVLGFGSSTKLAAAYGMAVTTTMVIPTILLFVVAREHWRGGCCAGPG